MGRSVIMEIMPEILESFTKAIQDPENFNEDGSVNWNFVDADCYMAMTAGNLLFDTREEGQTYIDQFDFLADFYLKSNTDSYLSS